MTKNEKSMVIAICIISIPALAVMVLYAGYIYLLDQDGQTREQALQEEYLDLYDSIERCMRENTNEIAPTVSGEMSRFVDELVAVAMTEFVDSGGNSIRRTPEMVTNEIIVVMAPSYTFEPEALSEMSELVVHCGGSTSPIYDSAVEFQEWIDGGTILDGYVRQRYPSNDFTLQPLDSTYVPGGSDVAPLDWITRTVNPYNSAEVFLDDD